MAMAGQKACKFGKIILAVLLFSFAGQCNCEIEPEPIVTSITPADGGTYGGMTLTINGQGFAKNQFNYGAGQQHLGNYVLMVSSTTSYECEIHKDGCNERQIQCFTVPMVEDDYYVQVYVDGVKIPEADHCSSNKANCRFRPKSSYTPHLSTVTPITSPPNTTITMQGKLITSRLGSHEEASTNGNLKLMLRVFANGQKCEVMENFDLSIPYGIELEDEGSSQYGYMKCHMTGRYVSNSNASFIVEAPYGRSYPDPTVLRIFADGSIGMVQTYARVDSVSPAMGSLEGGTVLTITGEDFDQTDKPLDVQIAGSACKVLTVTDTEVVCVTSEAVEEQDNYKGGRGFDHLLWEEQIADLDSITSLNDTDGSVSHLDITSFSYNFSATTKSYGLFKPNVTGEYSFEFEGTNCLARFLLSNDSTSGNLVELFSASFSTSGSHHHSTRYSLKSGMEYYMEIHHTSKSDASNSLTLGFRMYTTSKTSSQTGFAVNERQQLQTTSTVIPETQTVDFSTWATKSSVKDVQTIDVVEAFPGEPGIRFRLGVGGAYSAYIDAGASAAAVQAALNSLPTVAPDTVTVVTTPITNGNRYTVTFNSERGAFPLLAGKAEFAGTLSFSARVVTQGSASLNKAVLTMDGLSTPPISISSSASVLSAVEDLFSVRCHTDLTKSAETFESLSTGYSSVYGGNVIINRYPMCGRKSLQNPRYIYNSASAPVGFAESTNRYLCFGYTGFVRNYTVINFHYLKETEIVSVWRGFSIDLEPSDGKWHHKCIDIFDMVHSVYNGKFYTLGLVQISLDYSRIAQFDNIQLGNKDIQEPDAEDIRLMPPRNYLMNSVEVDAVEGNEKAHTIKMYPVNCSYSFSQFTVSNGAAAVTRGATASPPVSGTFSIAYNGKTLGGVLANEEAVDLKSKLQTLPGMGGVLVYRYGLCHSYLWNIEWLQVGGDRPTLQLDTTNLKGVDAEISVNTLNDGYAIYKPVLGDMMSHAHHVPQVTVAVNGIPSHCDGACSFEWTESSTPNITSVSPESGAGQVTLTITGTGFDSNMEVTVGGSNCSNVIVSGDELTCDLALSDVGVHDIQVHVEGKGYATSMYTYEYAASITAISPTSGHLSGGYLVTISGSGLSSKLKISLMGEDVGCSYESSTADTSLVCKMSPSLTSGLTDVLLMLPDGSNLTLADAFTFSSQTSSSQVSALSTSIASVAGGTELTITGSGFGSSANDIEFKGGISLNDDVTSWTDTSIVLTLPSLDVGDYHLMITTADGYADFSANSIGPVSYVLSVNDISPRIVSRFGGTRHVVTGAGFGTTAEDLSVAVGGIDCVLQAETLTDTQFSCVTEIKPREYTVTNLGSHEDYGPYYAWDHTLLEIEVGDEVLWKWSSPPGVESSLFTVQQIESMSAQSALENGFGFLNKPSPSGSYRYKFTQEGEFVYWSTISLEQKGYSLRGRVVVNPRSPAAGSVVLKLGDHVAQDNIQAVGRKKRDALTKRSACVPELSACDTTLSLSGDNIGSCIDVPVKVTEITPSQGTSLTTITIKGEGFSTSPCNNIVLFGDTPCVVESSTSTMIECKLSLQSEVAPGTILPISVRVDNLGDAQIALTGEVNRGFKLLPSIQELSHSTGSLEGGQVLTITGAGFLGDGRTQVAINAAGCDIQNVSYTQVVCMTGAAGADWSGDILVQLISPDDELLTLTCDDVCVYSYSSASTPTLSSITPNAVSGDSSDLDLTGSRFGTDMSAVSVLIGSAACAVTAVSDTQISCTVGALTAAEHTVSVNIASLGDAAAGLPVTVTSNASITSISPTSGSTNGGQILTITGYGFGDSTSVDIGGSDCEVKTSTTNKITCKTSAHGEGMVEVIVSSAGLTFEAVSYNYTASDTPTITSITPSSGYSGDTLTITGTALFTVADSVGISVGGVDCVLQSASSEEVVCTLGEHAAGQVEVLLHVDGLGNAAADSFTFTLDASSVSPSSGSYGGGQLLSIDGAGFDETVKVTVCGEVCVTDMDASTSSVIKCLSPSADVPNGLSSTVCDVVVTLSTENVTLSAAYTYDSSLGGSIASVSPSRGGTAGGTTLTITGTNLDNPAGVNVTIDGVACVISSNDGSTIECRTDAHQGSIEADVKVKLGSDGFAVVPENVEATFFYVDVWSSVYTWGGGPLPEEGDLVEIPQGQTLLLDMDTPVLKVLLIRGKLVFDEKDVELQAENILIVDGGTLQVGTEDEPFQHKGIITMHGHLRSLEMPIYGAKTLGVRNGTLDLHGKPKEPWTVLAQTANAGATEIVLERPVHWEVGDRIAIASTGHRHSQIENEEREIAAISADGFTLTLTEALDYKHLGVTADLGGGHTLEMRAEVGLLTHNVVFRGSDHHQWKDVIEACPAGFDTGQFATQTCFQGKFGEEMGSDEFGGTIMMHAPEPDMNWAVGRLSHIEVTHAGQAFRLGRYPIHFHLNGHQNSSYVRGCSVHRTFNRAINIHNTHDVMIEHNVIYHIMGGAVFLEDSVETGNTLQYNLAIFVIPSTSLLNDDITPAAFWLTHPTNIVRHNHAAGGSHFAFWYRMHSHPTGPSADSSLCPKNAPLTEFTNNTGHSLGWFALWTFADYYPMDGDGVCSQRQKNIPAVFNSLTAWHCEKGAEFVNGGDLQFNHFLLANNEKAGFEGKINKQHTRYSDAGPVLKNSVISSGAGTASSGCTARGIILPFSSGFLVDNVEFVGFNTDDCSALGVTTIDGKCSVLCGGYTYQFKNITWTDSTNKAMFRWEHEAAYEDLDGTLTGVPGAKVVPTNPTLDPAICSQHSDWSYGLDGSICDTPHSFHRYAWNNIQPGSLDFKNALLSNDQGTSVVPWMRKRLTHALGWMCMLLGGETYGLTYENAEQFTNTSNTGTFYDFQEDDYVIMQQQLYQRPDRFRVAGNDESNSSEAELTSANYHGDWYLDDSLLFSYMVSGRDKVEKRSDDYGKSRSVNFRVYTCYFNDCIPPPDPNTVPPPNTRPDDAIFWKDVSSWEKAEVGWGGNNGDGTFGLPVDGTDVKIFNEDWMVLNTQPAELNKIYIYGVLEFEPAQVEGAYIDYKLSATHILLLGGRLFVGWEDNPMRGNVEIILRGDWSTEEQHLPFGGPTVGAKAIGVFGSLDIHGLPKNVYWTTLASSADAGSTEIVVTDEVDWLVGEEIVITTTGKSAWESEVRLITAVGQDSKTLTLNDSLSFNHAAVSYTHGSYSYDTRAEVGLLTRNVKVIGHAHDDLQKQSFGGRILIGDYFDGAQQWTGSARIENAEFYHMGQEGYIELYDPRFAVAYLGTGSVSDSKPSYVRRNSFKDSFNTAIGVIDAFGLPVSDNVIHGTVEAGIRVKSTDVTIERNLVSFTQTRACYQERVEEASFEHHGSIEVIECISGVVMRDNIVAGSERSGYSIVGVSCAETDAQWSGNVAHGTLTGVKILPEYVTPAPCTRITGFTIYNTHDYGIYAQTSSIIEVDNVVLADNNIGVFLLVIGPAALSHVMGSKYVSVSESLIVGSSDNRDCTLDYSADPDSCNMDTTVLSRSWNSPSGGSIGVAFGQFMSATNIAPQKPWKGLMSYNSNRGLTTISDVTFANFGVKCNGKRDYIISTSPSNEDGQHPIETSDINLINVEEDSKLFFHRPNVGKINSADCVDMDCDAKKKCMVKDLDGTFLEIGSGGAALPQSEWEWNGDPRRGLGDYRIPKTLLTTLDGDRIAVNDIAPNKGVIGNKDCEWMDSWTAYKCDQGANYEMLIIESMDSDTETRRLSPVAILGDGYIDLINGPQDHGWCSGYTCRKRVSTFMALVATDQHYALYFTSTSPQKLRLTLIDAGPEDKISLEIFYEISNRIDVYVDGEYVVPENAEMNGDDLEYKTPVDRSGCEFCPTVESANGANFQNRWKQLMYVTVSGEASVDIHMSNMIMLTFDLVMTEDQFFGEQLTSNLAIFFDIPPEKIRVVNVIPEDSVTDRKKRAIDPGHIVVQIEIGGTPTLSINDTVTDGLSVEELNVLRDEIIDAAQTGELSAELGLPYSAVYVSVPLPDPDDPAWADIAADVEEDGIEIKLPAAFSLYTQPTSVLEGKKMDDIQVQLVNSDGDLVSQFGNNNWVATVELETPPGLESSILYGGSTSAPIVNGWANFSDLIVSTPGSGYKLKFYASSPLNMTHIKGFTDSFDVERREMDAVITIPSTLTESESFDVKVELMEKGTNTPFSYNDWQSMSFSVFVSLNSVVNYTDGELVVSSTNWDVVDSNDGTSLITNLALSRMNGYVLDILVKSAPDASYGFTTISSPVVVYPAGYTVVNVFISEEVTLAFADSSSVDSTNLPYFEITLFNHLLHTYDNVSVAAVNCTEGLECKFTVGGAVDTVGDVILSLRESVEQETAAIMFDGSKYSVNEISVEGESTEETTVPAVAEDPNALPLWVIIVIACCAAVVIILIIIAVIVAKMKAGNSKVNDSSRSITPFFLEENMTYIGAPPTSTKLPQLEPRKADLERINESAPKQSPTPKKTQVEPAQPRSWGY